MIILHLAFFQQSFILWGETPQEESLPVSGTASQSKKMRKWDEPSRYPYTTEHKGLLGALLEMDLNFPALDLETCTVSLCLPVFNKRAVPSHPLIVPWPDIPDLQKKPDAIQLTPFSISGIKFTLAQANHFLSRLTHHPEPPPGIILSKDILFWLQAYQFLLALLEHQRVLPALKYQSDCYWACWEPLVEGPWQEAFNHLAQSMPHSCRALEPDPHSAEPRSIGILPKVLLGAWLATMVDYHVRQAFTIVQPWETKTAKSAFKSTGPKIGRRMQFRRQDTSEKMSTISTVHGLHDGWLKALGSQEGILAAKQMLIEPFHKTLNEWQSHLLSPLSAPYRLCFRLEEPESPEISEGSSQEWFLRVLLQSKQDPSLLLTPDQFGNKMMKQQFQKQGFNPQAYMLAALGQASRIWPVVDTILQQKAMTGCWLDTQGTFALLSQYVTLLEESGVNILLPSWWLRKDNAQKLVVRANVKSPKMKAATGLSIDQLVEFDWQVALGGQALSLTELQTLAKLKQSLVRLRGQWVQMNPAEIQATLDFLKKKKHDNLALSDVIRLALGADVAVGNKAIHFEGVQAEGWVGDFLKQLETQSGFTLHPPPKAFQGTLRPYQQRGYSWLMFLKQWGLGACLADDMGLGKTVQTLAMIQRDYKPKTSKPVLLVCPTSVVGNWEKEAARFTPNLPVLLHHGSQRLKGKAFEKAVAKHALILTSYALLHRDEALLSKVQWQGIILDEAQNIKNSETKQAQTARSLQGNYRLALTGTPVENNIGDLWSIMQFLNPGFLGSQKAFQQQFFNPIQRYQDETARDQLKRLTGPFILRRLKTDKSIIKDLPDKMEMKTFCALTSEQASLYTALLKEVESALNGAEGIERKGLILAMITKLKQICNHPAHFLKDHSALANRSGKLTRLCEILEEIQAVGDRTLIFTQFSEMGELLQQHLQNTFGHEVLFLHGGVTQKKRQQMIERFQSPDKASPRIFILSLKAGGTGLNLTAANHVFHFDRWWNPAVENQATDRAFRIGQTRQVQVHKFVCSGTFEERIDELIERKQALADQVVGTGEQWLTELSNEELRSIFRLRQETVGV